MHAHTYIKVSKYQSTLKAIPIKLAADFSTETLQSGIHRMSIPSDEENYSKRVLNPAQSASEND